jgi:hypothetical protein
MDCDSEEEPSQIVKYFYEITPSREYGRSTTITHQSIQYPTPEMNRQHFNSKLITGIRQLYPTTVQCVQ